MNTQEGTRSTGTLPSSQVMLCKQVNSSYYLGLDLEGESYVRADKVSPADSQHLVMSDDAVVISAINFTES